MKISNVLTAEPVKYVIRIFFGIMVLLYLLWAMFHDESSVPSPIKFEAAVIMIAVAIFCNAGFFLSLGSRWAKF